jgi:hypothetical protein
MKRLLALLALSSACVFAQTNPTTWTLSASGTTSAVRTSANYHTVQVVLTGSPTGCSVRLEGSLDNSNWFDLSGSQSCTSGNIMFHVDGKPVGYARANLLTLSGGTSPTATISYRGQN